MKNKFCVALTIAALSPFIAAVDPDVGKTFEQICAENGFATENYSLTTSDGYILSLYRIPGTQGNEDTKKPAVLMMHCQDGDMMEWLWNSSEKAPALMLARAGYDVWLGNNRGSRYSSTHVSHTTADKAYWDYY